MRSCPLLEDIRDNALTSDRDERNTKIISLRQKSLPNAYILLLFPTKTYLLLRENVVVFQQHYFDASKLNVDFKINDTQQSIEIQLLQNTVEYFHHGYEGIDGSSFRKVRLS